MLRSCDLSDEAMRFSGKIRSLESLDLTRAQFSDASFGHLMDLHNLKSLNIYLTHVDNERVAALKKALPECEIK